MAIPYVKFFRGTPTAFENLVNKNDDTLYFISATDENTGKLYLGNKLISDNINSVAELEDILLSDLLDGQLLSYDGTEGKWVNKSVLEAIGLFGPASSAEQGSNGLVPAPGAGKQNAFLRGDGQWVKIEAIDGSNLTADEKSVSVIDEVITIKDFGIKYYKYVPELDGVEAHYEAQIVDATNPWKEGLAPKVILDENNQFVLGWFEEDPTIKNQIESLDSKIAEIDNLAKENSNQIITINSSVTNIADLLNKKANASEVYTKEEVEAKILEAGHLTRKTFSSLDEAKDFAASVINPESYIYMVLSGEAEDNKYIEYLYIEGTLELVGSWDIDLSDYATKDEVNTLSISLGNISTRVENLEEFMNSDYFKSFDARLDVVETDLVSIKESVTWKELV